MLFILTACGTKTCKESACDDAVYQDGYCKYHYTLNAAKDAIDDAAKDLLNGILGE